jgi:methylenetetrahydrofolate reductase (NADPH)
MSFKEALRSKDFVIAAELPLTPDSSIESVLADAAQAGPCIDGFLLTDNQHGQPHMSPAIAAGILQRNELNPILQLSCRNRNRIALLGELLGARAVGIDSLMLVRGNMVPEGYNPRPKAVLDLDVKQLIATAKIVNEDEKLGAGREFLIGTSGTVHKPAIGWQPDGLDAKADAGAHFIITQLCCDAKILRRYMEFLVASRLLQRLSIVVSVAVFSSGEMAEWLLNHRRQSIVPKPLLNRLSAASDPAAEGIAICSEYLQDISKIPGVSGVNFVAAGNLESISEAVLASGVLD